MINAIERIKGVDLMIEQGQYFVIHAARQSGKTTFLLEMMKKLNAEGDYYALYCSLEVLQGIKEAERGIPVVMDCIVNNLQKSFDIPFEYDNKYETYKQTRPFAVLNAFLAELSAKLDKPLVIFFDEADCLSYNTLISFLRQLRDGYVTRQIYSFVHSIALVGMRNIRDFKAQIRPDSDTLDSASPFNIATEAFTLKNFTSEEIAELYNQHTVETG
jgi:hypothetical protein